MSQALVARLTGSDIGVKLGISERTVNFHFGNILSKLDALNRNEAIAMAVRRGLIGTET
jgi:DNA-binding CsgD family transcriptional regulator